MKRAAAWTTFGFLIPHALFSPSRSHHPYFPSKAHRALEIALYLAAWYVVTGWMTSYVRTTTGAVCQLPLPSQLAQNPSFSGLTRIDQLPIVRTDDTGDIQAGSAFINVPQEYCSYGRNINPSAFPELFSLLKPKTKQLAEEGLYKPSTIEGSDIRARFFEGFDLSGHVFLLFASMAIIARQLAPALRMVYERGTLVDSPGKRIGGAQLAGHALTIVVGISLVSIWSFVSVAPGGIKTLLLPVVHAEVGNDVLLQMLWTTSAYFHTNPEKVAGYCESLTTSIVCCSRPLLNPLRVFQSSVSQPYSTSISSRDQRRLWHQTIFLGTAKSSTS